jgi:hypothetical protein
VRVHHDPAYRMPCALIELKEERETYLLTPAISRVLPGEFSIATIFTAINARASFRFGPSRPQDLMESKTTGIVRRPKRLSWL